VAVTTINEGFLFESFDGTGDMAGSWDHFDKIYCISLHERTDRQAAAREQFARVGVSERVEFVMVQKHPTDCEQGIYESHLLCMEKGLNAGAERILIFEDDVIFDRFEGATLANCTDFLSRNPRWHTLFLGCMVRGSRRTAYPSVRKIRYRSLTQAYVIHRRFAEILLRHPWQKIPYDDFLKGLRDEEMYAAYPSIAFQSNSRSDNERYLPLDRFRRLCGGLKNLQKRNEFYHRHRPLIIGAHVLAVLLLLRAL
jgi:GR25 family glycosyltransferase involved in LPS biosynthesis